MVTAKEIFYFNKQNEIQIQAWRHVQSIDIKYRNIVTFEEVEELVATVSEYCC